MGILERPWYGNLDPHSRSFDEDSDYVKLHTYVQNQKRELSVDMSEKQAKTLERLVHNLDEMNDIFARESFILVFRMGAKVLTEVAGDSEFKVSTISD